LKDGGQWTIAGAAPVSPSRLRIQTGRRQFRRRELLPRGGIAGLAWRGRANLINSLRMQPAVAYCRMRGDVGPPSGRDAAVLAERCRRRLRGSGQRGRRQSSSAALVAGGGDCARVYFIIRSRSASGCARRARRLHKDTPQRPKRTRPCANARPRGRARWRVGWHGLCE
jgi:hypothetical protein